MSTTAASTISFSDWEEDPAWDSNPPVPRLASAQVTFAYAGDLEAAATCRYAMAYGADGTGTALGFEEVDGTLGGVAGGFVLRHETAFTGEGVSMAFSIVPGSGTGGLAGISGSGTAQMAHGEQGSPWSLAYDLD